MEYPDEQNDFYLGYPTPFVWIPRNPTTIILPTSWPGFAVRITFTCAIDGCVMGSECGNAQCDSDPDNVPPHQVSEPPVNQAPVNGFQASANGDNGNSNINNPNDARLSMETPPFVPSSNAPTQANSRGPLPLHHGDSVVNDVSYDLVH